MASQTPISEHLKDLIGQSVRAHMRDYGVQAVDIRPGEDHDGDPVIFIEIRYAFSETPVDTAVAAGLTSNLRDMLWNHGETRFPHVTHKFDERQKVKKRRAAG